MVSCCHLCKSNVETLSHLVLECSFARSLCQTISSAFCTRLRLDGTIVDLWLGALSVKFSPQIFYLWKAAIIFVCWTIWKLRNDVAFDGIVPTIGNAITCVWSSLRKASSISTRQMNNFVVDLIIIKNLNVKVNPPKVPRIIEVCWRGPPPGWIKVNTDGTTFGSPGLAGSIGLFHTYRGFVKGCFAISIDIAYAFEVENVAAIHAIQFAWEKN